MKPFPFRDDSDDLSMFLEGKLLAEAAQDLGPGSDTDGLACPCCRRVCRRAGGLHSGEIKGSDRKGKIRLPGDRLELYRWQTRQAEGAPAHACCGCAALQMNISERRSEAAPKVDADFFNRQAAALGGEGGRRAGRGRVGPRVLALLKHHGSKLGRRAAAKTWQL